MKSRNRKGSTTVRIWPAAANVPIRPGDKHQLEHGVELTETLSGLRERYQKLATLGVKLLFRASAKLLWNIPRSSK